MEFYHKNYQEFFHQTVDIDPSLFLSSFARTLLPGMSILDIGCGSGRDLLWLKNQGFQVTGFEMSPGLADLARKHSGCDVIEGDFETFDFSPLNFNAVLASGSLVHVPHKNLPQVLTNITHAFNPDNHNSGIMYVSLKQGTGIKQDSSGRIFYLWQNKDLTQLFDSAGLMVIDTSEGPSAKNSRDLWIGYVLRFKMD